MSQSIKEAENLKPVSMFTITAKLITQVLKSVVESFGEPGQAAVEKGVKYLLEEQNNEMKEIAGKSDFTLGNEALFSYDKLIDSQKIEETFQAYKEEQENAGQEAHTMYAMMAKIFAHITKAVVDQFGEEGQDAVRNGVSTFGEERGRDIARRAAAVGKPNTMENYLSNYDMGRSELFEYETLFHPKEIEQTFTKCAFGEQWKKDGMGEYGILYCQMIDPSIAKGYNPNFEVIHDQYVLREGNCHFRFQMKDSE
jgi:hypothetical protein